MHPGYPSGVGGDGHDGTLAAFPHARGDGPGTVEDTVQIDREDGPPIDVRHFQCGPGAHHSGRVHQQVHGAEFGFDPVDDLIDAPAVGDVCGKGGGGQSVRRHLLHQIGQPVGVLVHGGHSEFPARECPCDGGSDSAGRAGDQGDPTGDVLVLGQILTFQKRRAAAGRSGERPRMFGGCIPSLRIPMRESRCASIRLPDRDSAADRTASYSARPVARPRRPFRRGIR